MGVSRIWVRSRSSTFLSRLRPGAGRAEPDAPSTPDGDGPAHARKDWRKPPGKPRGAAKPGRITAGIRADIAAKIAMPLTIGGRHLGRP